MPQDQNEFDVIVVGCGPGGAVAGETMALRGLKVGILEQGAHFGQKLCAGGVPAGIWTDFDLADSLIECRIHQVDVFNPEDEGWSSKSTEWGATVSRANFDTYLARRAEMAGAQLFPGCRCLGLQRESEHLSRLEVFSAGRRFEMRARIVVLADGFKSLSNKAIRGLPKFSSAEIAVATQVEVEPDAQELLGSNTLTFFFDPRLSPVGYAWCFPKQHGFTLGVMCLLSRAAMGFTLRSLQQMLDDYPPFQERIGACRSLGPFRSACIPIKQRKTLCDDGLLLVGDAAGQVSPLWGEGINYTMRAGQLAGGIAADAIFEGDTTRQRLIAYEQIWNQQFGSELETQRNQITIQLRAIKLPDYPVAGLSRFHEFGPFAEIAEQFSILSFPIRDREELINQTVANDQTYVYRGGVIELRNALVQLPDTIYPLKSWSDAKQKILNWLHQSGIFMQE